MFILDTNDVDTAMFAKGKKVESDIDLWHKRINHVNYQRLQELQTKQVVFVGIKGHSFQLVPKCEHIHMLGLKYISRILTLC